MGGGSESTRSVTTVELSPEQRELIALAMPAAREYASNPPELPDYSQISPFNPTQLRAQRQLLRAVPQQRQFAADTRRANQRLTSGQLLRPGSNPALRAHLRTAVRPLYQELTESVLPSVRGSAVTSGAYGGSRQGIAEGLASGRTAQAAGAVTADISDRAYQAGLDAMVKGLALTPQTMQLMTAPGQTTAAVGQQQYGMEQALLGERAYRDMYEQIAPFLAAQEVAALAAGLPGGSTVSDLQTPQPPAWQQALGLGIGGLSLLGGLGGLGGIGSLFALGG